jgi:sirohydrochlorin cobaltochelatase
MKKVVVLVMHGVPPKDFPRSEAGEYFRLHGEFEEDHDGPIAGPDPRADARRRYAELDRKMRQWPRTPENDPFHAGSYRMAERLRHAAGLEVIVAFNEFCGPSIEEALDQAASNGVGKVVAITPMMTPGGGHSEVDIPDAIERARKRHPQVEFAYAWPFDEEEIAGFLAAQVNRFVEG